MTVDNSNDLPGSAREGVAGNMNGLLGRQSGGQLGGLTNGLLGGVLGQGLGNLLEGGGSLIARDAKDDEDMPNNTLASKRHVK